MTDAAQAAASILLVEDDRDLSLLIGDFCGRHDFKVTPAYNGRDGLRQALENQFDLVILDVMLPVLDGFEVLRQLRQQSAVPVIMLTARTSNADRIAGLDSGADDYLPKPFEPGELLARIRAVLRRSSGSVLREASVIEVGDVKLDSGLRSVWLCGRRVDTTSIEFDILERLMRSPGMVVSREALTAALHQREAVPWERSIDVHISHLRKKLERGDSRLICTIRGAGYMFVSPQTRL